MKILIFTFVSIFIFCNQGHSKTAQYKLNSPEIGLELVQHVPSEWEILKYLSKKINKADYNYLKFKASQLGVDYKKPMPLKIIKGRSFSLDGLPHNLVFDATGRKISYNGRELSINREDGVKHNYYKIQNFLDANHKKVSLLSLFIPSAYAKNIKSSNGYHLAVLMNFMSNHIDDDNGALFDLLYKHPSIQALRLNGKAGVENILCTKKNKGWEVHITYYDRTHSNFLLADNGNYNIYEKSKAGGNIEPYFSGEGDMKILKYGMQTYCEKFDDEKKKKFLDMINEGISPLYYKNRVEGKTQQ